MYILLIIIIIIIITVIIWLLFTRIAPVFWWNADISELEKSKNYVNWKFKNLVETSLNFKLGELDKNEKFSFLFSSKGKNPKYLLPSKSFEKNNLNNAQFSWFGHSTILMKINNKVIISDPVFNNASPIPFSFKAFDLKNSIKISDLSSIDIVLITHDHYDHLDYKTIKELWNNVWIYIVPLWVKAHLIKWGIDKNKIQEMYWYDKINISDINFIFTPSRHFSGRNLNNRNSTLWWWWIINNNKQNIYISWDWWYFDEFKRIWENYWPFDIAFIENWSYNKAWSDIHMFPEQWIQVWLDLKAKLLLPIHWGKFDLSTHKWDEPINRFIKEAENKNIPVATPLIWEIFSLENFSNNKWWLDF